MADRRKRALGSSCAGPPSQRFRRASGRQELVRQMKAAAAVVVLVLSAAAVVTSVAVHASANKTRAAIHEPRRLVWEDHAADLKKRKLFRRMYRIEEPVFNKLAGLLEPILQRNDYYARKRYRRGAVPTKIRLAIGLRMMAGASYLDVAVLFGVSKETVFSILWQVVDAINSTAEVGPFFFPQSEDECTRQAAEWEEKSTGGAFQGVVAAGDGLFVKTLASTALNTPNVLSYYSGSKCGYGMNVQATCDVNYLFCSMSCIAPGSTNDWTAWNHSDLSTAVKNLPPGFLHARRRGLPPKRPPVDPVPREGTAAGQRCVQLLFEPTQSQDRASVRHSRRPVGHPVEAVACSVRWALRPRHGALSRPQLSPGRAGHTNPPVGRSRRGGPGTPPPTRRQDSARNFQHDHQDHQGRAKTDQVRRSLHAQGDHDDAGQ
ncbi:unnamed protein product [Ectocarpus sp. CCAP 1310/34]|nr:unnamed protein product [Ectocarpus sp. CCAP 1310/34]